MGCYFGCNSRQNKLLWTIFAVCGIVGAGFLIGTFVKGADCYESYDDCMDSGVQKGSITRVDYNRFHFGSNHYESRDDFGETGVPAIDECEDDYEDCLIPTAAALFWLWIVLWIVASVPLFAMCCCASPPEPKVNYAVQMQPTHGHTQYNQAHATGYPVTGSPGVGHNYNHADGPPAGYPKPAV